MITLLKISWMEGRNGQTIACLRMGASRAYTVYHQLLGFSACLMCSHLIGDTVERRPEHRSQF